MRAGSGLIALLLGLHTAPVLAANCAFEPFSTVAEADVTIRWTVKSGHACNIMLTVGAGIDVSRMQVVEAPAGGTATTPTLNSIRYVHRCPRSGWQLR